MLCCFFIKLPFKGLGATAGKVRAVAFDTVWGLARICLCGRPKEGGRNTKAKLAIKRKYQHKNHFVLRYNPLEFDNRIFEWICSFSGDKGDNGRKSRFHEVFEKLARGS